MQICENERKIWFQIRFIIIFVAFMSSCGYGIYHRIGKGEKIDDIAKKYNVRKEDIIEANKRLSLDKLKEGDYIYIPLDKRLSYEDVEKKVKDENNVEPKKNESKNKVFSVSIPHFQDSLTPDTNEKKTEARVYKPDKDLGSYKPDKSVSDKKKKDGYLKKSIDSDDKRDSGFILFPPIDGGQIISNYGMRNGRMHKGIDIKAPEGTPIKAAQDGVVVFSGFIRGYGNTVILKHEGDYFTVYAHNKYNSVKEGEFIKKGEVLGYVGMTGNAETPHLHFEVRKRTNALNPLLFLGNNSALR